jgi:hypothetical protein
VTPPEDDRIAPPARGDSRLPDPLPDDDGGGTDDSDLRSLLEDVQNLIEDGKTYLEAEVAFQKTRAAFIADRAKSAAFFGAVAAAFGFVALIGLTVGLIIALTPWLTAWGASGVVVLLLVAGGLLSARAASRRWNLLISAIDGDRDTRL